MTPYNSMLLRAAAKQSGLDLASFELALDFVEWTGIMAPVMALERARGLKANTVSAILVDDPSWSRNYQECRIALETAVRYQHSSGDALVRLLFSALTGEPAPQELHIASFERQFPREIMRLPVVSAVKQMRRSSGWSYICAFSNSLKHMSLMEHEFSIGLGVESRGLTFRAFEFKGCTYPACSQDEFDRILTGASDQLATVLNALRCHLDPAGSG